MFNPDSICFWRNLYSRQHDLLKGRRLHTLHAKDFAGWHDSEIYGRIRRNKEANIPGVACITRGFLVNFLLSGFVAFPTEISTGTGGATRNITAIPVEEAQEELQMRLFLPNGLIPAVPGTKEGVHILHEFANEIFDIARLVNDPHLEKTREVVNNALGAGVTLTAVTRQHLVLAPEPSTSVVPFKKA